MMRLVKNGLMFGNLVEVKSAALVERYNRALEHLIGKTTELTEFHIDISGYSPEIGHEFKDDLYLNPKGCNQMFILLSTDQKTAPLLNSHFSTSRSILRHYIAENENQLFALTAREAVAGELMNSVFAMNDPQDLLHINQIDIEADTIQEHVAEANLLGGHIEQFMTQDDAWWDDVLIAEMIELAKRTGNIQRNPVELKTQSYTQGNYYTSHFGGVYVFRDTETPTIIAREIVDGMDSLSIENILTFDNREEVAKFLRDEGLSELIVQRPNESTASIIKQKIDFITITTAAFTAGQVWAAAYRKSALNIPPFSTRCAPASMKIETSSICCSRIYRAWISGSSSFVISLFFIMLIETGLSPKKIMSPNSLPQNMRWIKSVRARLSLAKNQRWKSLKRFTAVRITARRKRKRLSKAHGVCL